VGQRSCPSGQLIPAIAIEEFAEPMCFTTTAHREAVAALLAR